MWSSGTQGAVPAQAGDAASQSRAIAKAVTSIRMRIVLTVYLGVHLAGAFSPHPHRAPFEGSFPQCRLVSTQSDEPSGWNSFFQIGTVVLRRSIAARQAAKASAR